MSKLVVATAALLTAYSVTSVAQQSDSVSPGTNDQGGSDVNDGILILDASGSMWGEIDGRHKILIARDVIGDLLNDLPGDHRLGLMAYGHNRKGDCTDIELISSVGADREDIRRAVNSLRPLGMTPLSESVQQAADTLRYKDNAATVILVSDGEETCDIDPCELGRTLEASGVDFTAHVIGFDLATDAQKAPLQCLAEATGGTYNDASNADELSDALKDTIAAPVETEAVAQTRVYLQATDLNDGPIIKEGLRWTVSAANGDSFIHESSEDEGEVQLFDLAQGRYVVEVNRPADGATASAEFFVRQRDRKTLTLALEIPLQARVRVEPEETAPAGSEILVYWEGPERDNDWIGLAEPDAPVHEYLRYEYVKTGNPVSLLLPTDIGEYEVRYVVGRPARQLASATIATTEIGATINAQKEANAGSMLEVAWTGPDYKNDWIGLVRPGEDNTGRFSYTYTKSGSPLLLQTPIEAGEYEVRYITGQGSNTLASQLVSVRDIAATLVVPETAVAGATIEVAWTGPDYKSDWVGTVAPDDRSGRSVTYAYTKAGSPLQLDAPVHPGDYLVRYVTRQSRILAETTIEVTPVTAELTVPSSAPAGSVISVNWDGPDYRSDYITISRTGAATREYESYQYTRFGSPLELTLPVEPGEYEIRYIQSKGRIVLTREKIRVTEPR